MGVFDENKKKITYDRNLFYMLEEPQQRLINLHYPRPKLSCYSSNFTPICKNFQQRDYSWIYQPTRNATCTYVLQTQNNAGSIISIYFGRLYRLRVSCGH